MLWWSTNFDRFRDAKWRVPEWYFYLVDGAGLSLAGRNEAFVNLPQARAFTSRIAMSSASLPELRGGGSSDVRRRDRRKAHRSRGVGEPQELGHGRFNDNHKRAVSFTSLPSRSANTQDAVSSRTRLSPSASGLPRLAGANEALLRQPRTFLPQSFESKVIRDTVEGEQTKNVKMKTAVFPKLIAGCPVMSLIEPDSAKQVPFSPAVEIEVQDDEISIHPSVYDSNAPRPPLDLSGVMIASPSRDRVRLSDFRHKQQSIHDIFAAARKAEGSRKKKRKKAKRRQKTVKPHHHEEPHRSTDHDSPETLDSGRLSHHFEAQLASSPEQEDDFTTTQRSPSSSSASPQQETNKPDRQTSRSRRYRRDKQRKQGRKNGSGGIGRDHPYRKPYLYGLEWQRKNFAKIVVPRAHSIERTYNISFNSDDHAVSLEDKPEDEVTAFPKVERFLTGAERRHIRKQKIAARKARRNEAATRIQSLVRGVQLREGLNRRRCSVVIQCWVRKQHAIKKAKEERLRQKERFDAAMRIQQCARARQARKQVRARRQQYIADLQRRAASSIQALVRGVRDRVIVVQLLADDENEEADGDSDSVSEGAEPTAPMLKQRYHDRIEQERALRKQKAREIEAERLQSYRKLSMMQRLRLDIIDYLGYVGRHLKMQRLAHKNSSNGTETKKNLTGTSSLTWGNVLQHLHSGFITTAMKPSPPPRQHNVRHGSFIFSDSESDDDDSASDTVSHSTLGAPELLKIVKYLEQKQRKSLRHNNGSKLHRSRVLPGIACDLGIRTNSVRRSVSTQPTMAAADVEVHNGHDFHSVLDCQPYSLLQQPVEFSRLVDALTVELILMDAFHRSTPSDNRGGHHSLKTYCSVIQSLQNWRKDDPTLQGQPPTIQTLLQYIPRPISWFVDRTTDADGHAEHSSATQLVDCDGWCRKINFDAGNGVRRWKENFTRCLTLPIESFRAQYRTSTCNIEHDQTDEEESDQLAMIMMFDEVKTRMVRFGPALCWNFPVETSALHLMVPSPPQPLSSSKFSETELLGRHDMIALQTCAVDQWCSVFAQSFFDGHDLHRNGAIEVGYLSSAMLDELRLRRVFELAASQNNGGSMAKGHILAAILKGHPSLVRRICARSVIDVVAHLSQEGGHAANTEFSVNEFLELCNRPVEAVPHCVHEIEQALTIATQNNNFDLEQAESCILDICGQKLQRLWVGQCPKPLLSVLQMCAPDIASCSDDPNHAQSTESATERVDRVLLFLWRSLHLGRIFAQAADPDHHALGLHLHARMQSAGGHHFKLWWPRAVNQLVTSQAQTRFTLEGFVNHFFQKGSIEVASTGNQTLRRATTHWRGAERAYRLHHLRSSFERCPSPLLVHFATYKHHMRRVLALDADAMRQSYFNLTGGTLNDTFSDEECEAETEATQEQESQVPESHEETSNDDEECGDFVWFIGDNVPQWNGKLVLSEVLDASGQFSGVQVDGQMGFEESPSKSQISHEKLLQLVQSAVTSTYLLWWRVANLGRPQLTDLVTLQSWRALAPTAAPGWFKALSKRVIAFESLRRRRSHRTALNAKVMKETKSPLI